MRELFAAGGVPMWFVLAFGAAALASATSFAWRPDGRRVDGVKAWSWATFFSILCGTAADLGAVCAQVPVHPEWTEGGKLPYVLMQGFGESMSPAIFGFTLLSLAWFVMAIGFRRLRPMLPEAR